GELTRIIGVAFNKAKRLGSVWQRLIGWGVISEEDARLLASEPSRTGSKTCPDFYSDTGARLVLSVALGNAVDEARRRTRAGKLRFAVANFLEVCAKQDPNPGTLDARVTESMKGSPYTRDEIRNVLTELRAGGEYGRIVSEAKQARK